MKLILLYGPPAVGKLTIAKELEKLTGYTLFDNHMVLNLLSNIFGYDHPSRMKLEKEFRTRIIEEAIKNDMNLIITGVIVNKNFDFYQSVIEMVRVSDGECFIVKLTATEDILKNRVADESRRLNQKLSSIEELNNFNKQYPEANNKFIELEHLNLDTSHKSPKESAELIIKHYKI